jgi:hypothetical protein
VKNGLLTLKKTLKIIEEYLYTNMVKNTVKTTYYNVETKEWDSESKTPYLKSGWTKPSKNVMLV